MSFDFDTFPNLKTERLKLRVLTFDDTNAIFKLRSNKEVNRLIKRETPKNLEDAKNFINTYHTEFDKGNRIFWAMEFEKEIIGTIVFHNIDLTKNYAEIGYELFPKYHGMGFMSEAMKTVLDFGFNNMNLKTIEAFTHKNNKASFALLEKHNFVYQPERKCKVYDFNTIWKLDVCDY